MILLVSTMWPRNLSLVAKKLDFSKLNGRLAFCRWLNISPKRLTPAPQTINISPPSAPFAFPLPTVIIWEGIISEKLSEIYRESHDIGLNVSLTVSIHNSARTCVFKSMAICAAVLNDHERCRRGRHHEQRGGQHEQHGLHGGCAQQA